MESLLLPHDPTGPVPKTPYVCEERYDRLPFLTYPVRQGRTATGKAWFDLIDYFRAERVKPTPLPELESFVQTWLLFGLIFEFLDLNKHDEGLGESDRTAEQLSLNESACDDIVGILYGRIVVYEDEKAYVRVNEDTLQYIMETARLRFPKPEDARKARFEHLHQCLIVAHPVLSILPKEFNHSIRFSIAALADLLTETVNFCIIALKVNLQPLGRYWSRGFYSEEIKSSMRASGWCPSDIARAETTFTNLQILHMLRFTSKMLPERDHSSCNNVVCKLYQINMAPGSYVVGHHESDCSCEQLVIDSSILTKILFRGDAFPLLKFSGDVSNLSAEIIESTADTPYIAVSHVWADGLGNPEANALHRCKIQHVEDLIKSIDDSDQSKVQPSLWIDTLCCPAEDGCGKEKAIEKLRLVYKNARHVLVLDSSLTSYDSSQLNAPEILARIFTSGWVRRLWTLQEGALNKSLYFQFADKAVSLESLRMEMDNHQVYNTNIRYRCFRKDIMNQYARLHLFFNSAEYQHLGTPLAVLEQALQYRGVSVATDEPLCIATLLSLHLPTILAVKRKIDRMQKLWELIDTMLNGLPAQLIFSEETKINADGWRWAPASFLAYQDTIKPPQGRPVRWLGEQQRGKITPRGFQVTYPGYRIKMGAYSDGKPSYPWPDLAQIPEAYMDFRDSATGAWYRAGDLGYATIQRRWETDEERIEYNKLKLFPLHDLARSNEAVIVTMKPLGPSTSNPHPVVEGIFATIQPSSDPGIVAVKTKHYLLLTPLHEEGYIYDVVEKVALELRASPLTDEHLRIWEAGNEDEIQESKKAVREAMKVLMKKVIDMDERFRAAVLAHFGNDFLEDIWIKIQDWFRNDINGTPLPNDQVWIVD
ncbi:hypothetical protein BP5796_01737 [Coleophoma crateriformis]|uniref:Heterokaryon incompatibility domain-containing protein n=1 Tax=Coleophoma crateriformis TaxID=565419 RepID=A0A3D8T1A1_9HELO|nr:hypothetical protein BP5796_01737 [Coleophoma crateriformis]